MFCPNCGAFYEEERHFCIRCGVRLDGASSPVPPPVPPVPPKKKGSHWVPILIMVILSLAGIVTFFATQDISPPASEEAYFKVFANSLLFDPDSYDGPSELQVPTSIGGQKVLSISESCFYDCDMLTTVILPDALEYIGWSAFEGCDNLRGIFIPEQVNTIDAYAFADCTSLEAICIPASVTYIAPTALEGCTSLNHVFYSGTYREWMLLYGNKLDSDVNIHCTDGSYWKGSPIP